MRLRCGMSHLNLICEVLKRNLRIGILMFLILFFCEVRVLPYIETDLYYQRASEVVF